MNLYCIECLKFSNENNIKINREIDGKINIYSFCVNCGFKNFETIDEEEISLLKTKFIENFELNIKTMLLCCLKCRKKIDSKNFKVTKKNKKYYAFQQSR